MSANLSENLGLSSILHTDLLKCPLCEKTYTKPRLLPCLHTVCNSCLQLHLTEDTQNTQNNEDSEETNQKEREKNEESEEKFGAEGLKDEDKKGKKERGEEEDGKVKKDEDSKGKHIGELQKKKKLVIKGNSKEEKKKEVKEEERVLKPSFLCPECKTSIPTPKQGADGFQTNYFLVSSGSYRYIMIKDHFYA